VFPLSAPRCQPSKSGPDALKFRDLVIKFRQPGFCELTSAGAVISGIKNQKFPDLLKRKTGELRLPKSGLHRPGELKCACVGGSSNVPLGFISLTENLIMIAMAVWMGATALGLSANTHTLNHGSPIAMQRRSSSTASYKNAHHTMMRAIDQDYSDARWDALYLQTIVVEG
jgi:hypothetical protein